MSLITTSHILREAWSQGRGWGGRNGWVTNGWASAVFLSGSHTQTGPSSSKTWRTITTGAKLWYTPRLCHICKTHTHTIRFWFPSETLRYRAEGTCLGHTAIKWQGQDEAQAHAPPLMDKPLSHSAPYTKGLLPPANWGSPVGQPRWPYVKSSRITEAPYSQHGPEPCESAWRAQENDVQAYSQKRQVLSRGFPRDDHCLGAPPWWFTPSWTHTLSVNMRKITK